MSKLPSANPLAEARIKNPLPPPTECPYCNSKVEIKVRFSNAFWPYLYTCTLCDAAIEVHPQTWIPVGTMANANLRLLRHNLKEKYDHLCLGHNSLWGKTKADAIVAKLEAEFCNDSGDLNIHLMEVDECEKLMEFFKHES